MASSWRPLERDAALLATRATDAPCPRGLVSRRGGLRLRPPSHWELPNNKPFWPLAEARDGIDGFERAGAAAVEGQIYQVVGGLLTPLPRTHGRIDLLAGPGTWQCKREANESWAAYVTRAAQVARAEIEPLLLGIEPMTGDDPVVVDLGWVTEDELSLFAMPRFVREAVDRAVAAGYGPWGLLNAAAFADGVRVRCAGPVVPGSFYLPRLGTLAEVPRDARLLNCNLQRNTLDPARFPSLDVLRAFDVNAPALQAIGRLHSLRILEISGVRADTLQSLTGLENLEVLGCHDSGTLTSLRPLGDLPRLRVLTVGHVRRWKDLGDLAAASHLEGLTLGGNMGARQHVPSLGPLGSLVELRYLGIGPVLVDDGSLRPLTALRKLARLEITNRFSLAEFAALHVALPDTEGPFHTPFYRESDAAGAVARLCPKCRRQSRGITLGKPGRALCPDCDAAKVRKHVANWELHVATAHGRRA
jgi:hypothetical protein